MPLVNGTKPPLPAGINMSCVVKYNYVARAVAAKVGGVIIEDLYGRSRSPLATDHLLENTDGVLRQPPKKRGGSEFSRGSSLLPSTYADARYIDDVIVSKATSKTFANISTKILPPPVSVGTIPTVPSKPPGCTSSTPHQHHRGSSTLGSRWHNRSSQTSRSMRSQT